MRFERRDKREDKALSLKTCSTFFFYTKFNIFINLCIHSSKYNEVLCETSCSKFIGTSFSDTLFLYLHQNHRFVYDESNNLINVQIKNFVTKFKIFNSPHINTCSHMVLKKT